GFHSLVQAFDLHLQLIEGLQQMPASLGSVGQQFDLLQLRASGLRPQLPFLLHPVSARHRLQLVFHLRPPHYLLVTVAPAIAARRARSGWVSRSWGSGLRSASAESVPRRAGRFSACAPLRRGSWQHPPATARARVPPSPLAPARPANRKTGRHRRDDAAAFPWTSPVWLSKIATC